MLGVILIAISQFFAEIGTSMGKYEVSHKRESVLAMGFLNAAWATVFLLCIGLFYSGDFRFSLESLPTFIARCALEVVLMFVSLNAILTADRSTFAFLRTLTIPLLLGADIVLGYAISTTQMVGISIMIAAFCVLTLNHGLSRRGKLLSLASALIPVGTITLYKYNITHFNSVEAEQTLSHAIMLVVLLGVAAYRRENLFAYMVKPRFFLQSIAAGFASVFLSFAYLYAPASIITSAKRAFEIIGAIFSGQALFQEKHVVVKLVSFALIVAGFGFIMA